MNYWMEEPNINEKEEAKVKAKLKVFYIKSIRE